MTHVQLESGQRPFSPAEHTGKSNRSQGMNQPKKGNDYQTGGARLSGRVEDAASNAWRVWEGLILPLTSSPDPLHRRPVPMLCIGAASV